MMEKLARLAIAQDGMKPNGGLSWLQHGAF